MQAGPSNLGLPSERGSRMALRISLTATEELEEVDTLSDGQAGFAATAHEIGSAHAGGCHCARLGTPPGRFRAAGKST